MLASVAKLQEIEGNENDLRVVTAMPQLVRPRHPTLVAATASPSIGQLRICSRAAGDDAFNTVRPSCYRSPLHNSLATATPIWEVNRKIHLLDV